jgi:hypothetical protein
MTGIHSAFARENRRAPGEGGGMKRSGIIRAGLLVVVVALIAGGVLYWRGIIGHPSKVVAATGTGAAKAPAPKVSHAPLVLPSGAPKVLSSADNDPEVVYPFAKRLMKVNALARRPIVTNAEYHDTDSGQRYFVAVVTSCKDLDALWSIKRGLLESKVEGPLGLKSDFPIFSFVEYFQQGQWGVGSCDGTT